MAGLKNELPHLVLEEGVRARCWVSEDATAWLWSLDATLTKTPGVVVVLLVWAGCVTGLRVGVAAAAGGLWLGVWLVF
ncbi:hypothetical protein GCM10009800_54390 [Nocardiopsis rhodophaea]